MPKFLDMVVAPSTKNYEAARAELLRRAYLGDDSAFEMLANLGYLWTLSRLYDYLAPIYGERRVVEEIFRVIGRLPGEERLSILADAYRYDKTVHDELFEELLRFKDRLISESAPRELVLGVNSVIQSLGKPEEVYRRVRELVHAYKVWKRALERGSAVDLSGYISAAPSEPASTGDVTIAKLLNYVVEMLRAGRRVASRDIRMLFGSDKVASSAIYEARKKGYLIWDKGSRTYLPTAKGLAFIEVTDITPEELAEKISGGSER